LSVGRGSRIRRFVSLYEFPVAKTDRIASGGRVEFTTALLLERVLKNVFSLLATAVWFAACASGPSAQTADSAGDSTAANEAATEKVCTTETGGRLGGRDRRVCRTVTTR
jgi:hypothetical protein